MKVTRKMLANYLGIHPNKCKPFYDDYLRLADNGRDYLTLSDVARVDGIPLISVVEIMGLKSVVNLSAFDTRVGQTKAN
ncbi:hypothetical protein [Flagellimonas sp. 2504JD4-2]